MVAEVSNSVDTAPTKLYPNFENNQSKSPDQTNLAYSGLQDA